MKKNARRKLVEQNIDWEQAYTEKTEFLKRQFEDVVGPGSYFRFEGEAPDGDRYYCIVGPAKVHAPRAKFFAGVRKLPATYSAGGKYFDSLDSAAKYAKETWGVPIPKDLRPYTSGQLHDISRKVKEWKEQNEQDEKITKDDNEKSSHNNTGHINKESKEKKFSMENKFNLREALARPRVMQGALTWISIEEAEQGINETWNQILESSQTYWNAFVETKQRRNSCINTFRKRYGLSTREASQLVHAYLGYNPSVSQGVYGLTIGPYYASATTPAKLVNFLRSHGYENDDLNEIDDNMIDFIVNSEDASSTIKANALRYKQDKNNVFGLFQRRFQDNSRDRVVATAFSYMAEKLTDYLGIVDLQDLRLRSDNATGETRDDGTFIRETTRVDNLSEESDDFMQYLSGPNISGQAVDISLSNEGSMRLLRSIANQDQRHTAVAFAEVMQASGATDARSFITYVNNHYPDMPQIIRDMTQKSLLRPGVVSHWIGKVQNEIAQQSNVMDLRNYITQQQQLIENGNWSDVIDEVLREQAEKHAGAAHISRRKIESPDPELELQLIMRDKKQYGKFLTALKKKQQEMINSNDPRAMFMERIDDKLLKPETGNSKKIGQQHFDSLKSRPIVKSMQNLKVEILRTMVEMGTDDPSQIVQALNQKDVRVQIGDEEPKFDESAIMWWLEKFPSEMNVEDENGNIISTLSYDQLLASAEAKLSEIEKHHEYGVEIGAGNIDDAFDLACIYYAGTSYDDHREIDPVTRSRFSFADVAPYLQRPEDSPNPTSVQLTNLRETRLERVNDEEFENLSAQQIEEQLGEEVATEDPDFDITELTDDIPEQLRQTPMETGEETEEATEDTQEEQVEDGQQPDEDGVGFSDIEDLLANDSNKLLKKSMNNMISMARELDNEGKYTEAEGIHAILRKYEKEIRRKR